MQTAHTYGVRAYNSLPTMHGTVFGQYIPLTFTPKHAVRRATVQLRRSCSSRAPHAAVHGHGHARVFKEAYDVREPFK